MNKARSLGVLRDNWINCTRCGLCNTRKNMVFGEGNMDAKVVILGEAPGAEEDREGRPFVGESGQILDVFLSETKLPREEVFILNSVGCRPTVKNIDDKTGDSYIANRAPSKEEKAACKERVLQTIYTIDPYIIVALGQVALGTLLGRTYQLAKMRGKVYTMHMKGRMVDEIRYPVFAMYHPAFLARNLDYSNPEGVWYQTGSDFKMVGEAIKYIDTKYRTTEVANESSEEESPAKEESDDE